MIFAFFAALGALVTDDFAAFFGPAVADLLSTLLFLPYGGSLKGFGGGASGLGSDEMILTLGGSQDGRTGVERGGVLARASAGVARVLGNHPGRSSSFVDTVSVAAEGGACFSLVDPHDVSNDLGLKLVRGEGRCEIDASKSRIHTYI